MDLTSCKHKYFTCIVPYELVWNNQLTVVLGTSLYFDLCKNGLGLQSQQT